MARCDRNFHLFKLLVISNTAMHFCPFQHVRSGDNIVNSRNFGFVQFAGVVEHKKR